MTTNDPGLLYLSLRHVYSWRWVRKFPHIPTNQERLREYRATVMPELGNTYRWPWIQLTNQARQYALDAIADSAPSPDDFNGDYADRRGF